MTSALIQPIDIEQLRRDFEQNTLSFAGTRLCVQGGSIEEALLAAVDLLASESSRPETTPKETVADDPMPAQAEPRRPTALATTPETTPSAPPPACATVDAERADTLKLHSLKTVAPAASAQPEPKAQPEPVAQPEPKAQPEPAAQLEPKAQPEPAAQLEPKAQPEMTASEPTPAQTRNSGFGAFEEDFFESYEPPAAPLTHEEMMALKDNANKRHRRPSARRNNTRGGVLGWLTALFSA